MREKREGMAKKPLNANQSKPAEPLYAAANIDPRRAREPHTAPASRRDTVNVGVSGHCHRIQNILPIWRPARCQSRGSVLRDQRLGSSADIIDIDPRVAVHI